MASYGANGKDGEKARRKKSSEGERKPSREKERERERENAVADGRGESALGRSWSRGHGGGRVEEVQDKKGDKKMDRSPNRRQFYDSIIAECKGQEDGIGGGKDKCNGEDVSGFHRNGTGSGNRATRADEGNRSSREAAGGGRGRKQFYDSFVQAAPLAPESGFFNPSTVKMIEEPVIDRHDFTEGQGVEGNDVKRSSRGDRDNNGTITGSSGSNKLKASRNSGKASEAAADPTSPLSPSPPSHPADVAGVDSAALRAAGAAAVDHSRPDGQLAAIRLLRAQARDSEAARLAILRLGIVPSLLHIMEDVPESEEAEEAVTALLNVSIHPQCRRELPSLGVLPAVLEVLNGGGTSARETAAALIYSLSVENANKPTIALTGCLSLLVDLLRDEDCSEEGRCTVCKALHNLSLLPRSRAEVVHAGAVPVLTGLLGRPGSKVAEKALAVLDSLADGEEGQTALIDGWGTEGMEPLMAVVAVGGDRAKEFGVSLLLLLVGEHDLCRQIAVEEAPIGVIEMLAEKGGTTRTREKVRNGGKT